MNRTKIIEIVKWGGFWTVSLVKFEEIPKNARYICTDEDGVDVYETPEGSVVGVE